MTKEDKDLLLKDLCARLPYGINCDRLGVIRKVLSINPNRTFCIELDNGEYVSNWYSAEDVKPYLRPMSSMTEDEVKKYDGILSNYDVNNLFLALGFLNSIHIDYNGLIPKGLALAAPEGMYNN